MYSSTGYCYTLRVPFTNSEVLATNTKLSLVVRATAPVSGHLTATVIPSTVTITSTKALATSAGSTSVCRESAVVSGHPMATVTITLNAPVTNRKVLITNAGNIHVCTIIRHATSFVSYALDCACQYSSVNYTISVSFYRHCVNSSVVCESGNCAINRWCFLCD